MAISQGGVRGAASGRVTIAPGGYASIFGAELAGGLAVAESVPFPTLLAGVQVEINGVLAPLHFVSSCVQSSPCSLIRYPPKTSGSTPCAEAATHAATACQAGTRPTIQSA